MTQATQEAKPQAALPRRLTFLYPGDLHAPTGGYVYDRNLIGALRATGIEVNARSLGVGYPLPGAEALALARRVFAGIGDGVAVIVDGLAYGVLADVVADHSDRLSLIALVHHPLAEESGLTPEHASDLRLAERNALVHARLVITTSPATADLVHRDFGVQTARLSVIEPGIDHPDHTTPTIEARAIPHLLAVGSLIPRKDYPTLLAAVRTLTDRPFHLDIVGSADFDPEHAKMVEDTVDRLGLATHVTFHGALDRTQLEMRYAAADIFALTTHYEGYGMAFVEAMAHGLPVVATGAGAVRDTVPVRAGFIHASGDSQAVGTSLRRLMEDHELRTRMSNAARTYVRRLPSWQDQARRLANLIGDMMEGWNP